MNNIKIEMLIKNYFRIGKNLLGSHQHFERVHSSKNGCEKMSFLKSQI